MKVFWAKRWKSMVALVLLCGLYPGYLAATGNFHEVIAGELYRSAQLTPADIAEYKKNYHIATILNLRGDNAGAKWYDAEVSSARALGIFHINFRMSDSRVLPVSRVRELIAVMRDAPKPLLIHCHSGANRTSLAAALYLAGVKMHDEDTAEGQISLRYGHLPLPFTGAYAMDETFENVEQSLFGYKS